MNIDRNLSSSLTLFSKIKINNLFLNFFFLISTLVLFCPLRFYSVHFGPIHSTQSTLVLFSPWCPLWFCSIHSVLFSPLWFYSVHSIHLVLFGPFGRIWSTLDLFSSFCLLKSYSVHFVPIQSTRSNLVLFGPFSQL